LHPVFRLILFSFGLILAVPILVILYLSWGIPISLTGIIYLVGYCLLVAGLLTGPWWQRGALILSMAGITLLLVTLSYRMIFPQSGSKMNPITLPGPSGPRLLNRIFDEQDLVLFGAKLAPFVGFVSPQEYQNLIPKLIQSFQEMHKEGVTPLSPALATYLGQERPDKFDAWIAEPPSGKSETAILYLHGFGGNFTLQCWLIGEAGEQVGALTFCPSTDPNGEWWNEQGIAILEESLSYLHQRGFQRIYLAGLSNGGIGSSRLAGRFKNDLAGLILISGVDPNAAITGLPILIIQGKNDQRIPAAVAEQYAALSAPNSTYRLFDGDHFILLKEADQVQASIADWITQQEHNSKKVHSKNI
jgi:hypothetical protein